MASYGALYAHWAPITAETSAALPTYGAKVSLGPLNKSTDTLNFSEASTYGDNRKVIYIKKFKDGSVAAEYTNITNEIAGQLYGATCTDGKLSLTADDDQPYGGYGFISQRTDGKKESFMVLFFPKVKANVAGGDQNTIGDNITVATDKVDFAVLACMKGEYKIQIECENEADAKTALDTLFAPTA